MEEDFRLARGLARTRDPVDVEVVASQLLARWSHDQLGGQSDASRLIGRAMVGFLESKATDDALALLSGLSSVDRGGSSIDAFLAILHLKEDGRAAPTWADSLRKARLESAWVAADVFGDQDFMVGRFSYEGAGPHDIAVLVDHSILGIVRDIAIVPARVNLRAKWERAPDIEVKDISDREYSDRLHDALQLYDMTLDPPATDTVTSLRPLVESRLDRLPRPRPIKRRLVSEAARGRLLRAFRSSELGASLSRSDQGLARIAIDYASDYHDDPLRWSPIVVELFLVDWLPRKTTLLEEDIDRLPDVLRTWLRFVGEQRGFAERLVGEMLAAVDMFEPGYRAGMRDSERFGPAKSVALQMLADSVDLSDPEAVQAWIDAFNARPEDERVKATGGRRD